jgi:hypothetical protein
MNQDHIDRRLAEIGGGDLTHSPAEWLRLLDAVQGKAS